MINKAHVSNLFTANGLAKQAAPLLFLPYPKSVTTPNLVVVAAPPSILPALVLPVPVATANRRRVLVVARVVLPAVTPIRKVTLLPKLLARPATVRVAAALAVAAARLVVARGGKVVRGLERVRAASATLIVVGGAVRVVVVARAVRVRARVAAEVPSSSSAGAEVVARAVVRARAVRVVVRAGVVGRAVVVVSSASCKTSTAGVSIGRGKEPGDHGTGGEEWGGGHWSGAAYPADRRTTAGSGCRPACACRSAPKPVRADKREVIESAPNQRTVLNEAEAVRGSPARSVTYEVLDLVEESHNVYCCVWWCGDVGKVR